MACPICKGKKVVDCPECKGKGTKDGGLLGGGKYTCKHCKGTGKIKCSCA
jgi:DnaJ-class molecular chaperone